MNYLKLTVAVLTAWCSSVTYSQDSDSLGVIGDNLDLYAVLDAFKDAENLEEFEKTLNDSESEINNIDLDEDGEVDYIQVHDEGEDDAHAIILRVDLSETETQDLAAIELEKTGDNEATVQIVGDEEIYGEDYIVEPKQEDAITKRLMVPNIIIINVWGWRSVRWIYGPTYVRWRSPWRWGLYPRWWKPWRPVRWSVYHGRHVHRHRHYHVVRVRRCGRAHGHFVNRRRTCVRIRTHHHHHVHHHHHKNHGGHKNNGGNKQHYGHAVKKNNGHTKVGGNQVNKENNHKNNNGSVQKNKNSNGQVKKGGVQKKNSGNSVNKGNSKSRTNAGSSTKKSGGNKGGGGHVKKSGGQKRSGGGTTKRR